MLHILRLFALLTTLCWLYSCQTDGRYNDMRTPEEKQCYLSLYDSMQHKTPHALELIRQQMRASHDSLTFYDYYLMYGRHYLIDECPDSLLFYAERTLRFVNHLEEQTPRTRGLAAMATSAKASYHYLLHHHPDTAINLYHKAYRLMMQSDLMENLPDLSANLADAYVEKDNLTEASKWYRRALYLNDSLALPSQQTLSFYMGLGRIYTSLGDFDQARDFYEMTDRRFGELKPNMQSYFLNNYGNYYYFRKDYRQALTTFRRLKAHIESYHAEQNFDMFLCKVNMADVFLNLHQLDSARLYVREAEEYFKAHQVEIGVHYAKTIRLGIALEEKQYGEIESILNEAPEMVNLQGDIYDILRKYLSRYYAAIGDYKRAYTGLQGNLQDHETSDRRRTSLRSSDIMMRLTEDTIRLHHQLELQRRETRYVKMSRAAWAIFGLLVIITLAFALWYNYERKRRLQLRLDMLTLRMANARQRISPHFVFNVLNSRMKGPDCQEKDQLMMLAKLIRTNLDLTRQNIVTLAEELDFVKQYICIERQLLGEDFTFRINVPESDELEQIKMPSMLVQILTENAILHGLKNKEGQKQLTILVEIDNEKARITVSDNGPGFDIRHYNGKRSRTGLNIIRTTVNVINQENPRHKVHFDIRNDNGCHAILTIPRHIKYTIT